MVEILTKEDLKETLQDVLSDRTIFEPVIRQIIAETTRGIVIEVAKDKFERVIGVDCMDAEARAESRKNFEFSEKARKFFESPEGEATKSDLKFARKTRTYFESEQGARQLQDAKRIASLLDKAAMNVGRFLIYGLFGGAAVLLGSGIVDPATIKKFFQL